jgi:hypothetical protein
MSNNNSNKYASISGSLEYCTYPSKHITQFKYVNYSCPFDKHEINTYKPTSLLQQKPHGGLYTSSSTGQPWHSIPVIPETANMLQNLKSANPPPGALNQYIGTNRMGNNTTTF